MPDIVFWPLFVTFAAITIGATVKMGESLHAKKLSDDECSRLREQLDILNHPTNKESLDRKQVNALIEDTETNGHRNVRTDFDIFHSTLALIAKFHSQEIPATPERIASELGLDPGITLAYMNKYHNEQFITFRNGGFPPNVGTSFFLDPKAWEIIDVISIS